MNIGEQIKKYRLEAKISQKELGKKIGISQQQIAQYESGKRMPKTETIRKIAKGLQINPSDLIDYSQDGHRLMYLESKRHRTEMDENIPTNEKAEDELITNYRKLNTDGRSEARKRVAELTEIKRYTYIEEPPEE